MAPQYGLRLNEQVEKNPLIKPSIKMINTNTTDLLFDDISMLAEVAQTDLQIFGKVNNDCDCVSYGTNSNRVQIDSEEITRIAGQEY